MTFSELFKRVKDSLSSTTINTTIREINHKSNADCEKNKCPICEYALKEVDRIFKDMA